MNILFYVAKELDVVVEIKIADLKIVRLKDRKSISDYPDGSSVITGVLKR